MNEAEHQRVIDELQQVIEETHKTMSRFEATGMDEEMREDYDKLLEIFDLSVKQQREHTLAMLEQGRTERPV
ncbi:hypothetical protein ACOJCM_16280 [Billgrantia sp. LNSP4103-1]|uniref:hypothetical protein n=1 Tax=Billgrantia sp. LNSP4103-1 TaxID=3410266 RepID=UPI00403F9F0F